MGELTPAPAWFRLSRAVLRRAPAGRFRLFEVLARGVGRPFLDRMAPEVGGAWYRCDLHHLISREICLTGRYDPAETALVLGCLAPGDTFVDVGANLGYFTLLGGARVGSAGRVVSLEPDPRMAAALRENVALNPSLPIGVLEVAAGDREETAVLSGFPEGGSNWGLSTLRPGGAHPPGPAFRVRCAPLDLLLDEAGIDRAALVKVDVEGAERRVLDGMADGLRRGRYRRVLVEMHPWVCEDFGRELAEMDDEMRAAGLTGFLLEAPARSDYYAAPRVPRLRPMAPGQVARHVLWALPGSEPA